MERTLYNIQQDPARTPAAWLAADPRQLGGEAAGVGWLDPRRLGEASVVPVEIGGQTMQALEVPGLREVPGDGPLYADYAPAEVRPVELRLIPYFAWANRGEGEMRVWLRVR